jgi:hypothetical protein
MEANTPDAQLSIAAAEFVVENSGHGDREDREFSRKWESGAWISAK